MGDDFSRSTSQVEEWFFHCDAAADGSNPAAFSFKLFLLHLLDRIDFDGEWIENVDNPGGFGLIFI
jgi:hypothetical protein